MSCTLIVAPIVIGAWPVLAAATASAAAGLGYGLSREAKTAAAAAAEEHSVEFTAGTVTEGARGGAPSSTKCVNGAGTETQSFVRDGITIRVRAQDGELRVRVEGAKSCADLESIGRDFLARTRQAFAYETARREYETRGFVLVGEEKDAAGRVRVKFRRLR